MKAGTAMVGIQEKRIFKILERFIEIKRITEMIEKFVRFYGCFIRSEREPTPPPPLHEWGCRSAGNAQPTDTDIKDAGLNYLNDLRNMEDSHVHGPSFHTLSLHLMPV